MRREEESEKTRTLNLECDSGLDLLPKGEKNAFKDIIGTIKLKWGLQIKEKCQY